jgi:hypothetical protein
MKNTLTSISVKAVQSEQRQSVGDNILCSHVKYDIQDGKEQLNKST